MKRLPPDERKGLIVESAVELSKARGLCNWTRQDVANGCTVTTSPETVKHYFPAQDDLRKAVLLHPNCTKRLKLQAEATGIAAE